MRASTPDDPSAASASLAEEVAGALERLDEDDLGTHPDLFTALGARLRAELDRLEGL